jgi:uncharacterized protein
MTIVWASLLIAVSLVAWVLTLLGMPGNWLIVVTAAGYAALVSPDSRAAIGWGVVISLLILAILGELAEFLAGLLGAAQAGGTRRGVVLALGGSIVGGLVGLLVGVPIPLVGPLIAAVLFAGLGALVGAMLGERWAGRSLRESWPIGQAAFRGRILGTLVKAMIGLLMLGIVILALLL